MMFVDDSIWPTRSAAGMQKMIRLHEQFCEFHQIFIHKTKSEHIVINPKGAQVRWKPKVPPPQNNSNQDTTEKEMETTSERTQQTPRTGEKPCRHRKEGKTESTQANKPRTCVSGHKDNKEKTNHSTQNSHEIHVFRKTC